MRASSKRARARQEEGGGVSIRVFGGLDWMDESDLFVCGAVGTDERSWKE